MQTKAAKFPLVAAGASLNAACAAARLGDEDQAFEWLARAKAAGFTDSAQVAGDADGVPDVFHTVWNDAAKGPVTGRATVQSGLDGRVLREYVGEYTGEGFGIGDAGDLNGDGFDDPVIGAWNNRDGVSHGGKIYLFDGRYGNEIGSITGTIPGATLGFDATNVGDVDGDLVPDLPVTAAWDPRGGVRCGRTYVVPGASALRVRIGEQEIVLRR